MTRTGVRIAATSGILLLVGGCSGAGSGFLAPLGPVAEAQRTHFWQIIALVMIVIVPVLLGLPLLVWRYRLRAPKGDYRPNWEFSKPLEFLVWGVPVLVVIPLAVLLWSAAHALDPWKPVAGARAPLQVQAMGFDRGWLFLYPETGSASWQQLLLPAGRPVEIEMTSAGVMQSLMIPRLAGQVYAMNGMHAKLNLLAPSPALIEGRNMQYDGDGFARQRFPVAVLPADRFASAVRAGPVLGADALHSLACSKDTTPRLFGAAPAGVFDRFAAPMGKATDTARWCDRQKAKTKG